MAQFNPGERVQGKYTVKSLLGEGGMNRVYLVQEGTELRALKVYKEPAELGQQYANSYNQFLKEISILTTIRHRGLPTIHDSREGCFYSIPGKVLTYYLITENRWDGDSSSTRIIAKKDVKVKGKISWEPSPNIAPLRFWRYPPYSGPMGL